MAMVHPIEVKDESYGDVLGQYFEVAVEISWLVDESGEPKNDQIDRYDRLCELREELRARLDDWEWEQDPADIKSILDQALSSNESAA